jgi:hypothetical protein
MKRISMLLVVGLFAVGIGTAHAASFTTYCPGNGPGPTAPSTRVFWMTLDGAQASCILTGDGNIAGEAGKDMMIDSLGWTGIDKDQTPDAEFPHDAWFTAGGTSFTIYAPAWSPGGFTSLAVALKVGTNLTPDWAVFTLPPSLFTGDSLTGSFGVTPTTGGGFSHAVLYGKGQNTEVPEPASMLLLGTGLLGVGFLARKRRK